MTLSMRGDPSRTRYSHLAMALHWLIAILLIGNLLIGYWAGWIEDHAHDPSALNPQGIEVFLRSWTRPQLMDLHRPLGILVLVLSLARLIWRMMTPQPPFAVHLAPWERWLAHLVHWAFYVVMIGLPLAGWIMISASARYAAHPLLIFGVPLPGFPGVPTTPHNSVGGLTRVLHTSWLPWFFWGLLILHVLGALKHQFFERDGELGRMIPWLREPGVRG